MSSSRGESQHSQQSIYGRRRSNTSQSIIRALPVPAPPPPPLQIGELRTLNAWVHDLKESPNIIFNHLYWPGVAEGDLLRVTIGDPSSPGFLFLVRRDDGSARSQLQVSIPKPTADAYDIRNNVEVTLTKVDQKAYAAHHVELVFQDQYLGRNDMWRLGEHLNGQCIFTNQEVTFIGNAIVAKVQAIFINGSKVSSAIVRPSTRAIYRSLSAKITIFIQVCKELWDFSGDGERYYEKIVHSFLPALFSKWKEAGTNHTVAIVLISRVYYEESEVDYAAGPLRRDERGNWYKDFFKVITDLEVNYDWKPTLVSLKDSFWDFQRDILLAHHYHRAQKDNKEDESDAHVRLVGQISFAHDGPVLEALNLALNPAEDNFIDRSLSLTGATTVVISPGTGYFRVSKQLLRLTTLRMLDQGVVLNLVLLTKQPLHQSPVMSFQGAEPKKDQEDPLASDALWCDDPIADSSKKKTFWWEPFWLSTTFWDKQQDLPFRQDRFVARAKMHEVQMLGLLEQDVLSGIEIPFLPEREVPSIFSPDGRMTKEEAEKFDNDIFSFTNSEDRPDGTLLPSPYIPIPGATPVRAEKRNQRNSIVGRFGTIEESPRKFMKDLPSEKPPTTKPAGHNLTPKTPIHQTLPPAIMGHLSTSPSQSSIHSVRSERSTASAKLAAIRNQSTSKGIASKLTPSWLFNHFRSGISEPQTTQVIAAGSSSATPPGRTQELPEDPPPPPPAPTSTTPVLVTPPLPPTSHTPSAPIRMPPPTTRTTTAAQAHAAAHPVAIKGSLGRTAARYDDDTLAAPSRSYTRRSPIATPPTRDDTLMARRRSATAALLAQSIPSSSPGSYTNPSNPSQPQVPISYLQSSMARRWHHILPRALNKHDIKWKSLVTPACLPLTVDYFPSAAELETCYDVFSWDFLVDPKDLKSSLVKPPTTKGTPQEMQAAWALAVMRGMAAVRLSNGFQFVLALPDDERRYREALGELPASTATQPGSFGKSNQPLGRAGSFVGPSGGGMGDLGDPWSAPSAVGAIDLLKSTDEPVFLSMTNEIHRISFNGDVIQVKRYVRRMPRSLPFKYQCLIWPKLGEGYTEMSTELGTDRDPYQWNRLDMLVAGYEQLLHKALRYWRTRFIVIPTVEPPLVSNGPTGEKLNEEEVRLLGIEKLAEQFAKQRLENPGTPVRLLPTTLDPVSSVVDPAMIERLVSLHAAGPLRKKPKSDKDIESMKLGEVAAMMREEEGLIKHNHWHKAQYPNSFTGYELVSWLVREFRDVSSRQQGMEWGVRLFERGLIEHCRSKHPFLDGHYFYRLKGEYSVPVTPNIKSWFKRSDTEIKTTPSNLSKQKPQSSAPGSSNPGTAAAPGPAPVKKRLLVSHSFVIDVDPFKRSDQSECVTLHCDILHNPNTVYHFELQWIGTTARCIEDQIRTWSRSIERYGLRLVEGYVDQIADIRSRNAFQSCFPIPLCVKPPVVDGVGGSGEIDSPSRFHFEYALLKKFGFLLDVEAQELYPELVDVDYSYRRSSFDFSQFVHRSGVAFVQVLDGGRGFLFLTNRLMGQGRMGGGMGSGAFNSRSLVDELAFSPRTLASVRSTPGDSKKGMFTSRSLGGTRSAILAEEVRLRLVEFCSSESTLRDFWDEQLALLGPAVGGGSADEGATGPVTVTGSGIVLGSAGGVASVRGISGMDSVATGLIGTPGGGLPPSLIALHQQQLEDMGSGSSTPRATSLSR
ncbi:vacuolar membrane-associated protein IML1 [Coprinopsis sp. MPI-PUGE-AT-0042]|nr:vacuolar membrane-associated protein IML1 [Coprinopsis sp. MPI-PUGE-AT-0042]